MGQEAIFEVLRNIAQADAMSYAVVSALTGMVFVLLRAMLPLKGLAFAIAPTVFWGGLSGIYGFSMLGVHFTSQRSADVVVAAAIGMAAALVVAVLLLRLLEALFRIRTPVTNTVPATAPAAGRSRI